jgi:hypothetical protein
MIHYKIKMKLQQLTNAIKDSRKKPRELVEKLKQLNSQVLCTSDLDTGIWIEQTVASVS